MRSGKRRRILEAVRPVLEPGETVRLIADVAVGQVSVKRQIGVGVAVAVVSLGQLTAIAQPRMVAVALTDRRMLFVDPDAVRRAGPGSVMLALELRGLRTRPYGSLSLNKRFDLEADDMPPLRLNFPLSGGSDARAIREAVDQGR